MRTLILAFVFSLLCIGLNAQQKIVRVGFNYQGFSNVIDDTYPGFGLGFETQMGNHFSLGIDAQYFPFSKELDVSGVKDVRRLWNFQPEVKYYPGQMFKGFYLGGHATLNFFDYKLKTGSETIDNPNKPGPDEAIGFGVTLGFMADISEQVVFSMSVAGDFIFNSGGNTEGAKFNFAVQVGYKIITN